MPAPAPFRRVVARTLLAVASMLSIARASADLAPIGPFTGDYQDTFNQHNTNKAVQTLAVLQGQGTIRNLTSGGAIKVEFSSNLNGDLVVPRFDMMMGQLGIADWEFTTPALRFGAWWENNSGADDATLEFFDAGGNLVGSTVADVSAAAQQWTWNGWESDTPFTRIRVTGNGIINGFIWYEDVQLGVVPEPAAALLLAAGTALFARRPTAGAGTQVHPR